MKHKEIQILKVFLLMVCSTILGTESARSENLAHDWKDNPWGLVYQNAVKANEPGQVSIHPVVYELNGNQISANVYTPADYSPDKAYPAIVVAHPNGGVKEQVAGLYAQRLAELGYITIAADASYQGASTGLPRNLDIPQNRINDISGMVDFISRFPGADKDRIGALGICGGGGYTYAAIQSDKRIKAASTISLFNTGRVRRNGFLDADKANIQSRLKLASAAMEKYALTGEVDYIGDNGNQTTEEIRAAMAKMQPGSLYHDGLEYYGITHSHPNSKSRYTASSLMALMTWDAAAFGALIDIPLLLIAGSEADTRYMTEEAFEKAGTDDKELFLIPGASHIQTYYVPVYVEQAVSKIKDFFGKKL